MVEHFPDQLQPDDYHRLAADRARRSGAGIGAAVAAQEPGTPRRWTVVVSDGERATEIAVRADDVGPHEGVPPEAVVVAVERLGATLAEGDRFDGLAASSTVVVSAAQLREAAAAVFDEGP
jgi:hypothetical protein